MSERELNRVEVSSQVSQGRMTASAAANVLGLSRRQVHRLLKRLEDDGPAAIRHKGRGRASNNRIDPASAFGGETRHWGLSRSASPRPLSR